MLRKFQLENSLKVITKQSLRSPVVSVQFWVRTGSIYEDSMQIGVSHFIEHLLFKGTKSFSLGQIAAQVEAAGGQINAYTSFEQTVFYITISKDHIEKAIQILSEMLFEPLFDPVEIDREREVVLEEIRRNQDNPARQASRNLFECVYKSHPYKRPVIGTGEVIEKISRAEIIDYFKSFYGPENMFLLVTGNFDFKELKKHLAVYLKYPRTNKKKMRIMHEPVQNRTRVKIQKTNFIESRLHLAWPSISIYQKDLAALDLLSHILGQGESSILYQNLRLKSSKVNSIYASHFTPKYHGFFAIIASLNSKHLKSAESILLECLKDFLSRYPTQKEMQLAVTNIESSEYFSLESVDGMASRIGEGEFYFEDPEFYKDYLKRIRKVSVSEVRRVALQYLKPEKTNFAFLGNIDKKTMQNNAYSFLKKYKKVYDEAKTKRPKIKEKYTYKNWKKPKLTSQKIESFFLNNGIEVLLLRDGDVPVCSIQFACLGGSRSETTEKMGITNLLSNTWVSGTENLNELELKQKLEAKAAYVFSFSGRNSLGLKMNALSSKLDESLKYYFDILNRPLIRPRVFIREKEKILDSFSERKDYPAYLASQAMMESLFHRHKYSFDIEGKEQSLRAIQLEEMIRHLYYLMNPKQIKFSICGNFDYDQVLLQLESEMNFVNNNAFVDSIYPVERIHKERRLHISSEKEQSHLFIGYQGYTFTEKKRYVLQVIHAILSGQSGRLFLELRDKESLAYSVSPIHMEGVDTGYFGAYIACKEEKAPKALKMLLDEFQKLCVQKVDSKELDRAIQYICGKHDISLQKNSSIASHYLFERLYSVELKETQAFKSEIHRVSSQDIMAVAKEIFEQKPVICFSGRDSL